VVFLEITWRFHLLPNWKCGGTAIYMKGHSHEKKFVHMGGYRWPPILTANMLNPPHYRKGLKKSAKMALLRLAPTVYSYIGGQPEESHVRGFL
jgi:hypothetical protein